MARSLRQELKEDLAKQGYYIQDLGTWPAKATYYKPSGEAMPNLPADPYSMERYLKRGFTLVPPTPSLARDNVCEICGFEAKSELGLASHMRKHKRESKEGESE